MKDLRNDAPIMLARTKARLRGATPAEIERNVLRLESVTAFVDSLNPVTERTRQELIDKLT